MHRPDLDKLRAEIRRLEGRGAALAPAGQMPGATAGPWSFDLDDIDRPLAGGLTPDGLHEISPTRYGDSWAALAFALALLQRRAKDVAKPILWCATAYHQGEFGHPYGEGLRRFGLDPARFILISAASAAAAAFVLEEGLRCGQLAAVLAQAGSLDPTRARRLALAASAGATPALLLTAPTPPGILTAASRWHVANAPRLRQPPGTPPRLHEFDWRIELVRNRHGPAGQSWALGFTVHDPCIESAHEQAFRFHLSAASADRKSAAA